MTRERVGLAAAALLLALFAGVAISRSSAVQTEQRVRAEMRDSVAFQAAKAIAPLRDSMGVLQARAVVAERGLATMRRDARSAFGNAGRVSDSSRAVLATTNPDSIGSSLVFRAQLASQVLVTDSLAAAFRAYLAADSTAHVLIAKERASALRLITAGDTALAAMTHARDAWRGAATCRVWLIKCPTRTQSAIGGALVVAAFVVLR